MHKKSIIKKTCAIIYVALKNPTPEQPKLSGIICFSNASTPLYFWVILHHPIKHTLLVVDAHWNDGNVVPLAVCTFQTCSKNRPFAYP